MVWNCLLISSLNLFVTSLYLFDFVPALFPNLNSSFPALMSVPPFPSSPRYIYSKQSYALTAFILPECTSQAHTEDVYAVQWNLVQTFLSYCWLQLICLPVVLQQYELRARSSSSTLMQFKIINTAHQHHTVIYCFQSRQSPWQLRALCTALHCSAQTFANQVPWLVSVPS